MSVKTLFFKIFQATVALLGENNLKILSDSGKGFGEGIHQQAAKNRRKKYKRIVNRHNLKIRFCKSVYTLAMLAKLVND